MKKVTLICAVFLIILLGGCGDKKEDNYNLGANYSEEKGTVKGQADFATETPNISIKNISTYKGVEIDYSSGVEVTNTEKFEDFQMWVDASMVDIYTAGVYEAVYKFVYDGNTMEKTILVNVLEREDDEPEPSGENNAIANGNGNSVGGNNGSSANNGNGNNGGGNSNNNNNENNNGNGGSGVSATGSNSGENNTGNADNKNTEGNSSAGGTEGTNDNHGGGSTAAQGENSTDGSNNSQGGSSSPSTSAQSPTKKPVNNGGGQENTTTRREIITSSGNATMKYYTIGYMDIELLSGTVVKIKCTSTRYIVSTRTDTSKTTKNGVNYKLYKLVITYSTGEEQVLETYEEKA